MCIVLSNLTHVTYRTLFVDVLRGARVPPASPEAAAARHDRHNDYERQHAPDRDTFSEKT